MYRNTTESGKCDRWYLKDEKLWFFSALNIIFQFFLWNKFDVSFVFVIPWIFFIFAFRLSKVHVIFGTLIPGLLVLWMRLSSNKHDNLLLYLNKICDLNKLSTQYVQQKYETGLAQFINLFIFNFQKNSNPLYQEFSSFGISYILVISGFHLGLFRKILSAPLCIVGKTIKRYSNFKNQELNTYLWGKISNVLVFLAVFVYWWSTRFIVSGFRVLIMMLFNNRSKIIMWSWSVIISFVLFPYSVISYSFILSFFIPLIFILIDKNNNNKIVKSIYKNFGALIFSHLLLLPFSKKIYFLSYINLIIFYPIIVFLFLYYLLFFWCGFLEKLHYFFYNTFDASLKIFNINRHYLYLGHFSKFHSALIVCVLVMVYLYYENKNSYFQTAHMHNINII